MQHLEASGAVRHIYVIRRLKVKLLIMQFSPLPCYLVRLSPIYSPQHHILKHRCPTLLEESILRTGHLDLDKEGVVWATVNCMIDLKTRDTER